MSRNASCAYVTPLRVSSCTQYTDSSRCRDTHIVVREYPLDLPLSTRLHVHSLDRLESFQQPDGLYKGCMRCSEEDMGERSKKRMTQR